MSNAARASRRDLPPRSLTATERSAQDGLGLTRELGFLPPPCGCDFGSHHRLTESPLLGGGLRPDTVYGCEPASFRLSPERARPEILPAGYSLLSYCNTSAGFQASYRPPTGAETWEKPLLEETTTDTHPHFKCRLVISSQTYGLPFCGGRSRRWVVKLCPESVSVFDRFFKPPGPQPHSTRRATASSNRGLFTHRMEAKASNVKRFVDTNGRLPEL